uniref:Rho GTPase activating protein n=1 Tax=Palpitomonas bilix TaxID=652834 RepID=A0A7S3D9M7_9EUKA|mmetsp:Transcript_27904/g.71026  ORF Transcript_27904/g.71026 Transcript_27904/m.71026 type:complete len:435 (+) Transcript_27904:22-1326(+)
MEQELPLDSFCSLRGEINLAKIVSSVTGNSTLIKVDKGFTLGQLKKRALEKDIIDLPENESGKLVFELSDHFGPCVGTDEESVQSIPFLNSKTHPTLYLSTLASIDKSSGSMPSIDPETEKNASDLFEKDGALSTVLCKGYVKKVGGKTGSKWQQRWLVALDSGYLYYFRNEGGKGIRGALYAGNASWSCQLRSEVEGSLPPGSDSFIFTVNRRTEGDAWRKSLRFSVDSEEMCDAWKKCLWLLSLRNVRQMAMPIVRYLRAHAMGTEGIFRVSGSVSAIEDLKAFDNRGLRLPFDRPDIKKLRADTHALASFLKSCLRDLPYPLIPPEAQLALDKLSGTPEEIARQARAVLASLAQENHQLLRYLFAFLHDVSLECETNKMSAENLAIVFSPNLFHDNTEAAAAAMIFGGARKGEKAVKAMIENFEVAFGFKM